MYHKISEQMLDFLKRCPTAFHTIGQIGKELDAHGYQRLWESESWPLTPGGKYYVTRNDSSILAFSIGTELTNYSYHIAASHSDAPTFKIKEHAELEIRRKYLQLNTEGYGGMLCSTWFDRPLSVAGRVIVKEGERFVTRLVKIERDLLLIPSVAIHMNRSANEGFSYNKQVDMLPLFGGENCQKGTLKQLLARELEVPLSAIYGSDLYLYNRQEPTIWGAKEEFVSSPRLDDLQCAYASLQGFLEGHHPENINIYACFDNEEVGSKTKQGAGSTFLYDVLRRIHHGLGKKEEDYYRAVANSLMLSADNAHAVHPNHPEKTDYENCVYLNKGIVIKSHAGQKYTSDALSIALFREICEKALVPIQFFANRSDSAGGSTLGNISSEKVSLKSIDIGLAQLAMHSAYETAGVKDTYDMIKGMTQFYSSHFSERGGEIFYEA